MYFSSVFFKVLVCPNNSEVLCSLGCKVNVVDIDVLTIPTINLRNLFIAELVCIILKYSRSKTTTMKRQRLVIDNKNEDVSRIFAKILSTPNYNFFFNLVVSTHKREKIMIGKLQQSFIEES